MKDDKKKKKLTVKTTIKVNGKQVGKTTTRTASTKGKAGVASNIEVPATPETRIAEISKEVAEVEVSAAAVVVKSPEDYNTANDFLVDVKGRIKRIEEMRLFFVKPLKDQAKNIDAMFAKQSAPLEAIEAKLKRAMADFQLDQDKAAKKEEERLAALRDKQNERRDEKGLAPIAVPLPTVARPDATVRTGGGTSTAVKVFKFRITDIDKVPRHLLRCEVKHAAVQAQIDAGARQIDGLEIYEDVEIRASAK